MVRLRILKEVNEKFDEVLQELNENGTEFARLLAKEVENMRVNTKKELENVWSFVKSKLVSIEQGQKLFYDEIFPKLTNKIEVAISMARDSASCTAACLESNKEAKQMIKESSARAEKFVAESRRILYGLVIALILLVLPISVASVWKLIQDYYNQKQTVSYLEKLKNGVRVEGLIEVIKAMDEETKKSLFSQIGLK